MTRQQAYNLAVFETHVPVTDQWFEPHPAQQLVGMNKTVTTTLV